MQPRCCSRENLGWMVRQRKGLGSPLSVWFILWGWYISISKLVAIWRLFWYTLDQSVGCRSVDACSWVIWGQNVIKLLLFWTVDASQCWELGQWCILTVLSASTMMSLKTLLVCGLSRRWDQIQPCGKQCRVLRCAPVLLQPPIRHKILSRKSSLRKISVNLKASQMLLNYFICCCNDQYPAMRACMWLTNVAPQPDDTVLFDQSPLCWHPCCRMDWLHSNEWKSCQACAYSQGVKYWLIKTYKVPFTGFLFNSNVTNPHQLT